MAKETIPGAQGWGKPTPDFNKLKRILKELQGLKISVADGAAAVTNIPVPGIAANDTILAVLRLVNGLHTFASAITGVIGNNSSIKFTSRVPGEAGNLISVILKDPAGNNQALSISVSGSVITVNLATDGAGAITSTAAQVIAAVNGNADAAALVAAANNGASNGTGVAAAVAEKHLTDGAGTPTGIGDVTSEATIFSAGNIRLSTTDTSRDRLIVFWHDKE